MARAYPTDVYPKGLCAWTALSVPSDSRQKGSSLPAREFRPISNDMQIQYGLPARDAADLGEMK